MKLASPSYFAVIECLPRARPLVLNVATTVPSTTLSWPVPRRVVPSRNVTAPVGVPASFPAKLARFLLERARAFDFAPERGVVVVPCELVERNGDALHALVVELSRRWRVEPAFARWLPSVTFCNTLVDRIVPGAPSQIEQAHLTREMGYRDALVTVCEPYRLLAIEGDATLADRAQVGEDMLNAIIDTIKPGVATGRNGRPMAPHINFWIVARGINIGLHTRMYFSDEAKANAADPVINLIEWQVRRQTLIAQREQRGGQTVYRFDIRLQGDGETVFFDL